MMDFIYELYQIDNFVLYLTIALVILIVLFVLVLIFGKRDQKLEETKRLQKIEMDTFKEEKGTEAKVEVPAPVEEKVDVEPVKSEAKSIFDDTAVMPSLKEEVSEPIKDDEEIKVTTFEPKADEVLEKEEEVEIPEVVKKPVVDNEEENKPINIKELDEIKFDDLNLEKDLNELESIKKEFNSIEIPQVTEEVKREEPKEKAYKAGPQVFSSVFVKKDEPVVDVKEEKVSEVKKEEEKPKVNLFSIQDDEEEIELPALKKQDDTKTIKIDDISGETYNIK